MNRWIGRTALVTGASAGIGRGLALELANQGMKVAACARNFESLQSLATEVTGSGEILPIRCDLRNESEILEMFEQIKNKYGGVDMCINNAGIASSESLLEGSTDAWRDMMNVNVLALSICTREAIKSMKARGVDDGQILHINSKHAVTVLTEGLRRELRAIGSNIRVGSVSPANVDTELGRWSRGSKTFKQLDVKDIVDTVIYILSAPPHSEVHDVLIRSVEQIA